MLVKFLLLSAILSSAAAVVPSDNLKTKLLANLRTNDGRLLEDMEQDNSWMGDYSIKFEQCHSIVQFAGEEDQNEQNDSGLYVQRLVRFRMCPSDNCHKSCKYGGEYIMDMLTFVDLYTEAKMESEERACENVRENCDCDDDKQDDEACEAACYEDAGLDYCVEAQEEDEEAFELQEYLECKEMEQNNNNNNNNGQEVQYFIGPKCSDDGYSINLGVFTDESCSTAATDGIYEKNYYGNSLPYSSESIVKHKCFDCKEVEEEDENNYYNNYNQNEEEEVRIIELCEQSYEVSAKCEDGMDFLYYPNTGACSYIEDKLYTHDEAYTEPSKAPVFVAWFFFLSTLALGGVVYWLYSQQSRGKVDLAAADAPLA